MKFKTSLLALTLLLPLSVFASPNEGGEDEPCHPPHHGRMQEGDRLPRFLLPLNLTEKQRTDITELLKTQREAIKEKMKVGKKAHGELRRLAFSADYSEEKAKALVEQNAKLLEEGAIAKSKLDHSIFLLLTPEQQAQLLKGIEQHEAKCADDPKQE